MEAMKDKICKEDNELKQEVGNQEAIIRSKACKYNRFCGQHSTINNVEDKNVRLRIS